MRHKDLFKTYIWLIETIHREGSISLTDLSDKWAKSAISNGAPMSRTTFNRHREEIEDIFGIKIVCSRNGGNRYYIESKGLLDKNSVENWMVNTISLSNILAENRSVSNRILLESIPTENINLQIVIDAMRKCKKVEFDYKKYYAPEIKHYEIEPYCVKLYHRRWYLLGRYSDTQEFRLFAFDRISSIRHSSKKFKIAQDFNATEYFNECFGVALNTSVSVQKVILRAYTNERYYLRDLPLHHSQRLVGEGKDFFDYEITIRPTEDFLGYLLSRSKFIKILSPRYLAEQLKEMALSILANYQDDN
ncbi:MAG: WYL domain-containing protein [Muribaculaceae bacterium]|nr:WYL domain-containing protein [Muribaculaceae bacterium]